MYCMYAFATTDYLKSAYNFCQSHHDAFLHIHSVSFTATTHQHTAAAVPPRSSSITHHLRQRTVKGNNCNYWPNSSEIATASLHFPSHTTALSHSWTPQHTLYTFHLQFLALPLWQHHFHVFLSEVLCWISSAEGLRSGPETTNSQSVTMTLQVITALNNSPFLFCTVRNTLANQNTCSLLSLGTTTDTLSTLYTVHANRHLKETKNTKLALFSINN